LIFLIPFAKQMFCPTGIFRTDSYRYFLKAFSRGFILQICSVCEFSKDLDKQWFVPTAGGRDEWGRVCRRVPPPAAAEHAAGTANLRK
jgi:hypothetical protein